MSGVALVVEDLTEERRMEAEQASSRTRSTVFAPGLVEQLLRDPSQLKLGGIRSR